MIERVVTVVPEAGLHARPATKFVEAAKQHDAEVNVGRPDDELVSAGSMLAVTGLGVANGEEVRITTDGPDEEAAMEALVEILTTPEEDEEADAEDDGEGSTGGEDGAEGSTGADDGSEGSTGADDAGEGSDGEEAEDGDDQAADESGEAD